MCTVILLLRPGHAWPVLIAANRDEMLDRPWDSPGAYWPGQPDVVAGRDRLGGGTWMAVRGGMVAAVLNRPGSLGPAPGKQSRGGLPLLAVQHGSAAAAASAVTALDGGGYRSFILVVADVTSHDPNDPESPRAQAQLPRFAAAAVPDPAMGDWIAWQALLADRSGQRGAALNVPPQEGFGTVCSSMLGVPAAGPAVWLFAAGPPDQAAFEQVAQRSGQVAPPG